MLKNVSHSSASFFALVGTVLGFFCSYLLFAPADVGRIIASYVAYPVVMAQHTCIEPLKTLCSHKRTLVELEQAVTKLEQEKQHVQAQLVAAQATETFAQDTKELREFKSRYACINAVLAHVIMKSVTDQAHFFLIDAGSQKGITKDMVAVYQNHLVGRITEVYPLYSKVTLITDKSCKIAAYCLTTKAIGIHAGLNNDTQCALNHVSHLQQVQLGDTVLSSGEGLVFPRGFALGTVTACSVNGMLWEVTTKPLFDIHAIKYCYVLQKGNEFALKEAEGAQSIGGSR